MISSAEVFSGISSELRVLEEYRLELKRKLAFFYKILGGTLAVSALLFVVFWTMVGDPAVLAFSLGIVSLVVIAVAWFSVVGDMQKVYVTRYKNEVVNALVARFDSNLKYRMNPGPSRSAFQNTELFQYPDRFNSEDMIYGRYGKTDLTFGEVHAEDKRTRKTKNGTQTYYVTIFKGILFSADFHKEFHGRTFVLSDNAENMLGGIGRAFQKMVSKKGTKLVQMDDVEFEKKFAIYSSDQVECRYVLSNSLMRRILDLKARFGGQDLRFCFKDSSIHIAVPYSQTFLEPNIDIPATDPKQIQKFIAQVGVFLEIVEELNLNTRIWSKD